MNKIFYVFLLSLFSIHGVGLSVSMNQGTINALNALRNVSSKSMTGKNIAKTTDKMSVNQAVAYQQQRQQQQTDYRIAITTAQNDLGTAITTAQKDLDTAMNAAGVTDAQKLQAHEAYEKSIQAAQKAYDLADQFAATAYQASIQNVQTLQVGDNAARLAFEDIDVAAEATAISKYTVLTQTAGAARALAQQQPTALLALFR